MKKAIAVSCFLVICSSQLCAAPVYWFLIDPLTSNEMASARSVKTPNLWSRNWYRVMVTSNQYIAGWTSLSQPVKDAAKVTAKDWRDDYDNWGAPMIALADLMREVVNEVRTNAGLSAYSKVQWKQKLKDKKPKK